MSDLGRDFEGRGKDWPEPLISHEGRPLSREEMNFLTGGRFEDVSTKYMEMERRKNPCSDIPEPALCLPVTPEGVVKDPRRVLYIRYVNWKREEGWRRVIPLLISPEFGSPFHPSEWVFLVYDLDKRAERSYAFSGILECVPAMSARGEVLENYQVVPRPEWKREEK